MPFNTQAKLKGKGHVLMAKFSNTLSYRIYPAKLDIFIGFQNLGIGSRLDISDLGRTYPMYQTYRLLVRFQSPSTGSRLDTFNPGWIYTMRQTYSTIGWVPKPWQSGLVRYNLPPSDISNLAKINIVGFRI
jgi:hypothetical protein